MSGHAERSDPTRREHFVYRVYDAAGELLYVGCTMNPKRRATEHRANRAKWLEQAAAVRMVGPTDYHTARRWEREALLTEGPAYNLTPAKQSAKQKRDRKVSRRIEELLASGADLPSAYAQASADVDGRAS